MNPTLQRTSANWRLQINSSFLFSLKASKEKRNYLFVAYGVQTVCVTCSEVFLSIFAWMCTHLVPLPNITIPNTNFVSFFPPLYSNIYKNKKYWALKTRACRTTETFAINLPLIIHKVLFTEDFLTCHSSKSTGVNNKVNDSWTRKETWLLVVVPPVLCLLRYVTSKWLLWKRLMGLLMSY